jgi:hypothetical protein
MKLEIITANNEKIQIPEEGHLSAGILAKMIGYDESFMLQVIEDTHIPTSPGTRQLPDRPPSIKFQVKDFPAFFAGLQKALKQNEIVNQAAPTIDTGIDFQILLPDQKSRILFLYEKNGSKSHSSTLQVEPI